MSKPREEDYRLKLSVTTEKRTVEEILCEVYLPKRLTEPVELIFRPSKEQTQLLGYPFEFSVFGEIKDSSGNLNAIIKADKVYDKKASTKYWEPELSESLLVGEPVDLKIVDFLSKSEEDPKDQSTIKGTFWLTSSIMLSPDKLIIPYVTGETRVEKIRDFIFTLFNGIHLTFDHYYKYLQNENAETVSFAELVAEFEVSPEKEDINLLLDAVDDFLMLTSFAARQRCVCLGWDSNDSSKITRFFRRDMAIPEIKRDHSYNEALIDLRNFKDFIITAYNSFIKIERKDLIRQAIHRAIGREGRTIESTYLTLYSAFETLILYYRQTYGTELILYDGWDAFRKDVEKFIKTHSRFTGNTDRRKRKLIYEKLPELNRISFRTAFHDFCEHYNVDLNNLWPVVDRREGISLSDIRNKLIHGDTFTQLQHRVLMCASEHLRWIVERSILCILGWDVANSKVSERFLSINRTAYKEWREDRKILSNIER